MASRNDDTMYRINCMASDLDSLYHKAAVKLGLSDSVMFVMYLVYEGGGRCPLAEIRKKTGISKQTLNSALRSLEKDGVVFLENNDGRAKTVCFTEKGSAYAGRTVGKLASAEHCAFDGWSKSEVSMYLSLMEKYNECFKRQIEKLGINDREERQ